jgi:hypothetical protein
MNDTTAIDMLTQIANKDSVEGLIEWAKEAAAIMDRLPLTACGKRALPGTTLHIVAFGFTGKTFVSSETLHADGGFGPDCPSRWHAGMGYINLADAVRESERRNAEREAGK